ncbi:MAG: 4-hydroxy-tetrahydrodipicolinate reductase [Bacteroidetes bacterium SW_10_40_5]|nr:MAG: 4-hydroxy-tetrahydrodipicolinate reductase [Bacteroidetes bacterium SW_10_40_5]
MKLILLGYGRMGKEIEQLALKRGHEIIERVTSQNRESIDQSLLKEADAAVDFSIPEAARKNILDCFKAGIAVVVGTTGWDQHMQEIQTECQSRNGALFYAPNFNIGVNILFQLNKVLANLMNEQQEYDLEVEESHHPYKKDAPSGTANALTIDILSHGREEGVIGEHKVLYHSNIDEVEIRHKAYSREGFAEGAVKAAEWLQGSKGIFTMEDFLGFKQ